MRKTFAMLAVIAAGAAALGPTAGLASADDPNVTYSNAGAGIPGFPQIYSCATTFNAGVPGQYGAWGNFIDGCTVTLTCRASSGLAGPGGISDTQTVGGEQPLRCRLAPCPNLTIASSWRAIPIPRARCRTSCAYR